MAIVGIGRAAYYKPLVKCGMEELAARQAGIAASGGILFARNPDGEEKTAARQHILDLFHPNKWGEHLRILTMPGVHWRFERKLLAMREAGWMRARKPRRTLFTSVENDRSIFYAAVAQMPGLQTPKALVKPTKLDFAEVGVKTNYAAFFFANIDDLMKGDRWRPWDAAWLDFTGPLTKQRLALISHFYRHHIYKVLIVTALKARWNQETSRAIERAGGHSQWLRAALPGKVLHDIEYFDTSPMAQFAIQHPLPLTGAHNVWTNPTPEEANGRQTQD